jgi:hypothetical protein
MWAGSARPRTHRGRPSGRHASRRAETERPAQRLFFRAHCRGFVERKRLRRESGTGGPGLRIATSRKRTRWQVAWLAYAFEQSQARLGRTYSTCAARAASMRRPPQERPAWFLDDRSKREERRLACDLRCGAKSANKCGATREPRHIVVGGDGPTLLENRNDRWVSANTNGLEDNIRSFPGGMVLTSRGLFSDGQQPNVPPPISGSHP